MTRQGAEDGAQGCAQVDLQAELIRGGRTIALSRVELTGETATIWPSEPIYVGDRVLLRLAAGDEQPFEIEAHAVSKLVRADAEGTATVIGFVFRSDGERESLQRLLASWAGDEPSGVTRTGYRVLLVEDSAMIRDVLVFGARRHLTRLPGGVVVDIAEDGEVAWRKVCEHHYDLAIVDFYLPKINGAELVDRMRSDPRFAELPVVGFSVGGTQARRAFLDVGVDVFVDKPVVARDFFTTVERIIRRER